MTKREIERRLKALEENTITENGHLEIHPGGGLMYGTEPELTNTLQSIGFVAERRNGASRRERGRLTPDDTGGL